MWMMTQHGFVSVVRKGGGLQVRARDRKSLEAFCDLAKVERDRIVEGGGTDYAYRVRRVSKRDVKRYMTAELEGVDYANFKDRAKAARGKQYADALGRVWGNMLSLTPRSVQDKIWGPPKSSSGSSSSHWADASWWYRNFPKREAAGEGEAEASSWARVPSLTEIMEMQDDERRDLLNDLDLRARMDEDVEDLLIEVERLLAPHDKPIHDMTEDEWRAFMEQSPGGV